MSELRSRAVFSLGVMLLPIPVSAGAAFLTSARSSMPEPNISGPPSDLPEHGPGAIRKRLADTSSDELEQELAWLDYLIDAVDCFGTGDLIRRELIARELDRRDASAR